MTKNKRPKNPSRANRRKNMKDHPRGSLTVPENKLAGGEPIFSVDPGPNIASPDLRTPSGQTTHE
jgi:hypothetical protein